jgi:hypothetical protein
VVQGTAFAGSDSDKLKLSSVPTWRSGDELTFVRPLAEGGEVVRHSVVDQAEVVMSKEWPKGVTKNWLWHEGAATTAR